MLNKKLDIRSTIDVDARFLNYGKFFPGKLLGSTILVSNKSKLEQIVDLSIDTESERYFDLKGEFSEYARFEQDSHENSEFTK